MNRAETAFASLAIVLIGLGFGFPAHAQNYPNRPISFVVPFAPGGLTDVPARVLAPMMQEKLGATVVVENKTGASGVVGATHVLRAEPDGYTLLVNALADVQNLHYLKVPYNAIDDFTIIGKITDGPPLVLIINSRAALQDPERTDRRRHGPSEQNILRDFGACHVARDSDDATQSHGRHQDR